MEWFLAGSRRRVLETRCKMFIENSLNGDEDMLNGRH